MQRQDSRRGAHNPARGRGGGMVYSKNQPSSIPAQAAALPVTVPDVAQSPVTTEPPTPKPGAAPSEEDAAAKAAERSAEFTKQLEHKRQLRAENVAALQAPSGSCFVFFFPFDDVYVGEAVLKGLDASIKRNTAFTKKIRAMTSESAEAVITDFKTLNLKKYHILLSS